MSSEPFTIINYSNLQLVNDSAATSNISTILVEAAFLVGFLVPLKPGNSPTAWSIYPDFPVLNPQEMEATVPTTPLFSSESIIHTAISQFGTKMAVPVHPEDPAPDQPRTPPPVGDLLQAARYGDLEDVQSSLAQGTSVSSQDTQGRTALHMASANGHLDVVKYLIEHGANVNMCNMEQNTPLHYAVLNAHKPVVEFLISQGANVSAVNRYDRTPVDEAVSKGDTSLIECITRAAPIPEEEPITNGLVADHDTTMEDA